MKRNCPVSSVLAVAVVCFLQFGYAEQVMAMGKPKPELTTPESTNSSEKGENAPKPVKGGPAITFEKIVHDFGSIAPGSTNVCEFKFRNTGSSLLKITDVSKTCGCTPFTLDKKEYEPGERGVLKVKYHAGRVPASSQKTLYVSSNDKTNPKVKLTIRAKIVSKIGYEPKNISLLPRKENASCPEITIRSLDDKSFSIIGFKVRGLPESSGDVITVDYDSSVKAKEFVLQPKVDTVKLEQGLGGSIEFIVDHPGSNVVAVPFEVLPRFKITPPSLIVYRAEPGKAVTKEVWILDNYEEGFEVESTTTQEGTIKVLSREKVDSRCKFELEITPPDEKGRKRFFTDTLFVNLKGGETLKIVSRVFYPRVTKSRRPSRR